MNSGVVSLRFTLFFTLLVVMVSCQQGPEPDTPGIVESVPAPVSEATQRPPTATQQPPTATRQPPTATQQLPTATLESPTATLESPTATVVAPTARPTSEPSDKGHVERGQIVSKALADNLIGDSATRNFVIYLPPSYDSSEKYFPVVFVLHGFYFDEWDLVGMTISLDEMIANGEVEEMILVFVNGKNRFSGSWYLSSPTIGDYEGYIARELVDHIDTNYRTLPNRDSRGITGCSMGGNGALHLALKYPDIFSVAVPMSGIYIGESTQWWDQLGFRPPEDFDDYDRLNRGAKFLIAVAAGAASNPNQPPLYIDMPFEQIDGETQIVQEVYEKVNAAFPVNDVYRYLNQPVRLRGLMIYHGEFDGIAPVAVARDFDEILNGLGVEHEYLEVREGHCDFDYAPVLSFMSDHLASR